MKQTKQKSKAAYIGLSRIIGRKNYIRYKTKNSHTNYDNIYNGWILANEYWLSKIKELQAIKSTEKHKKDTIKNVFEKFLDDKIKYRKLMPQSIKNYKSGFKAVFKKQNVLLTEKNVKQQIQKFVETATVADTTINIYLTAVNVFLNWASDEENNYIPKKQYTLKYKRKINVKVKDEYSREDYELLSKYFQQRNKKEMYLLIQFLWLTGARVGETLTIHLKDLDLTNKRISVPNKLFKGQQEYLLLVPEAVEIVKHIKELAIERKDNKLFSWKERRLPNRIMERAEHNIGIKKEGRGLHGFRRGFSDRLFEMGLDIPDVQEVMRHRDIATTIKHYKKMQQEKLIDKMTGLK